MVELKYENKEKFRYVLPGLSPFHTQCSYIYAIFKRIEGSEVRDLVVKAGLIADGSVDQALKGKHYNRALRLYKLLYEALARIFINHGEENGLFLQDNLKDFINNISE